MKRKWLVSLICFALCLLMAISLAACGQTDDPKKPNTDDVTDQNPDDGDNENPSGGDETPTPQKVTVTFKNGDIVITTREIDKGTAIAAPATTPEAPDGKQFKSWQKDGVDWDFTAVVNENMTLVAVFEDIPVTRHDITFKDAEGNVLKVVPVVDGEYLLEADVPAAPDKSDSHLVFVKWVLENDANVSIDYDMEIIEPNTYVPVYATVKYSVTFTEANSVATWEAQQIEHGQTIEALDIPIGYVVESVKNGTETIDLTAPVTSNLELVITLREVKYTVTFKKSDGTEISTVQVPIHGNAALPTPPANSYYTASAGDYAKLFNVTAEQTITLDTVATSTYASGKQWINSQAGGDAAAQKFNIDFTTGGWKLTQPPFQTVGAYFTMYGNYAKFSMQFWVDKGTDCEYNIYVDDILVKVFKLAAVDDKINATYEILGTDILTAGMHTIKVVAVKSAQIQVLQVWKGPDIKDNYDVTFKNDDGTDFTVKNVASGAAVTAPDTNPTKTAFLFKEWQLNGKTYDFTTPVTQDIVLTPAWDFDAEHYVKVTFKADGAPYGEVVYVEKNGTVTKPATDPTKANYKFKYWTADGTNEFVFTTALTADTELTAYFELDAVTHTVTFKDSDGNVLGTSTVIDGKTAQLPPAPDGYYWTCTMADLANITADKDVILGKVAASEYNATSDKFNVGLSSSGLTNDLKTKYNIVLGHTGSATADPALQSWGLVIYQAGQYVEFKSDIAGELKFGGNCEKKGQHFVLGLYIDGVLYKEIKIDTPTAFNIKAETNLPAGEHTIRLEVLSLTIDADGEAGSKWAGIVCSAIGFQEKATAATSEE